jgi:cbb3-type cytochrome oxidase subunit 3
MRRFRFHLGTLVILVLLLGVGFAAVRESNETWDSSIFTITLGVLLISILLAIHRTERRRAFWLGFALFGSAYMGFSLAPSIESRLLTTKALAYLDSKALAYLDSKVPDHPVVITGQA